MPSKPEFVRELPKLCYRAVEFRATEPHSDGRTLEGYAAVFDEPTRIDSWEGTFDEEIAKGAFRKTLQGRTPVLQFDHGRDARTGSVPIGSVQEIREDDHGLYVSARMYVNDVVEPIRQAIEGGSIDGMSFRFRVINDEWRDKDNKLVKGDDLLDLLWSPGERGPLRRIIREVDLFELGPVVFPAYDATSVGVRSLLADLTSDERNALVRDLTQDLRPQADPPPEAPASTEAVTPEPAARHSEPEAAASTSTTTPEVSTREETIVADTMTVEERGARQSEIRARLAEIDTEYNGSALPEEARTEWDELNAELDDHERAIADTLERRERLQAIAENPAATERVDNSHAGYGAPSRGGRRPENIYDLAEIRGQARSIDELSQLYLDNAMRAVEQARFPGAKNRERAQEQVERLLNTADDDSGTLARRILATGSPVYDRAFGKAVAALSTNGLTAEESRALSLGTDSAGGFAVPFQLDPSVILTSDGVADPLRMIARVEQIVGKEWQGVTSAGVTVGRSGEAAEADDDSPTLAQPTVKATRVDAFVPFSLEIESDWARMRAELTMLLADAKVTEEADAFINGDGTGNNPEGLLTGTTNTVSTATANTYASDDLYAVEEDLGERFLGNARWLGHRSAFNATRQLGSDSDGGDLWVRLADGLPPELIGYSAHRASEMPAFDTTTGAVLLVLGDFRQFLIVDRIGMSVELVPHLFGATRRPTGQRGIFAYWRNSSKVLVDNAFRKLVVSGV